MERITQALGGLIHLPAMRVVAILLGAMVAALLVRHTVIRVLLSLSSRTKTDMDDQIVEALRRPLVLTLLLAGAAWAVLDLRFNPTVDYIALGLIKSIAVFIWGQAGMRVGSIFLQGLSRQMGQSRWVQPKTLPLFDIALKILVIGGSLYFAFIAWDINVTSWLASAGIVGIAVGFAAKDTLANLFAGVFILADAPYKLGDFIILDESLRGMVTDIGIRSTRLLTRDDIEVTVPNAVIANAKIVNETAGPHAKSRVRIKVQVAYDSDIDQVKETLLLCAQRAEHVCDDPEPRVRFREFGGSGLLIELLAWIEEPVFRGSVQDELNTRVLKAFRLQGIEIPYSKQDIYIKENRG